MPTVWTDEAAARLANMIDLSSASHWAASAPVFAMLHHHPGEPAAVRLLTRALDVPIPEAVSSSAPDDECVAIAISAVFPPEQRRGGAGAAARVTVAVDASTAAVVYRYRNGVVRRTDTMGATLRSQALGIWQLRMRFELARRRTSSGAP